MTDTPAGHLPGPGMYEICVAGHLGSRWATRFDGMTLTNRDDGTAVIAGPVADQAALHGLLRTLRDLGIPLIWLTQVGTGTTPAGPQGTPGTTNEGD